MAGFFHILLAEDSPEDAHLTEMALEETGLPHHLHVAHDGEACLNRLNGSKEHEEPIPDLILLDLNMPKQDGKSVLRQIKTDTRFKDIPTVILSTSEAPEDIQTCYELGANSVLNKPLSFVDFCKIVNGVTSFWLRPDKE